MLRIEIINTQPGNEPGTRDYRYRVFINYDLLEEGWLLNHRRSDGWRSLVAQLVDDESPGRRKTTPPRMCLCGHDLGKHASLTGVCCAGEPGHCKAFQEVKIRKGE
jgi:hypothetical protein